MNHKHETLWPLKRCTLYILCTLILSICFHLTIKSNLTLIQNEFWFPKCCHLHSKVFFLCLGFPKHPIKIFVYYTFIILVIQHFFGWKMVKSGLLVMCFHPKAFKMFESFAKSTHFSKFYEVKKSNIIQIHILTNFFLRNENNF
jgi:hypothetical protein